MIEILDWDSTFFNFNIAHINSDVDFDEKFINKYVLDNDINLLQCCVPTCNRNYIHKLEENKFSFSGLNITFNCNIESKIFTKNKLSLKKVKANEENNLISIVENSFLNTRYNYNVFNKSKVSEMYKIWVKKSIIGDFDNEVLSLKLDEIDIGFVTVNYFLDTARIGLLAISNKLQGRGYGKAMIKLLKAYLFDKNIKRIVINTQGNNIVAQNLYISSGCSIEKIESWYYKEVKC